MKTKTENKNKQKKESKGNTWVLITMSIALAIAFALNTFVFSYSRVIGRSMLPTLKENDWVFVNRLAYINQSPKRNDVIVFKKKDLSNEYIVKRVIALENEQIEIADGLIYINNIPIADNFSIDKSYHMEIKTVPKDCYFVLGDNRLESNDSRYWKEPFVKKDEIIGKAVFKYFKEFKEL